MRFLILLPVLAAIVAGTAIPETSPVSEALSPITTPLRPERKQCALSEAGDAYAKYHVALDAIDTAYVFNS
ncbi:hypothetical protein BZA77DRAFT_353410 [Pyronema omphalodes]|nr:hypothetical protein BZA77DRAFT_353410 [Pyronema omphalodes]